MGPGNRTTVKLCARRTGLNFNGRQSGGTLGRASVWKWPVAQSAVPLGLCPAPLNLVLPPAFARAEAGSTGATRFSGIWVLHPGVQAAVGRSGHGDLDFGRALVDDRLQKGHSYT